MAFPLDDDEITDILEDEIIEAVSSGWRVEAQGADRAVIVWGHRPNHLLHFLVGLFTLGTWWVVWLLIGLFGGEKRKVIEVMADGDVIVRKA